MPVVLAEMFRVRKCKHFAALTVWSPIWHYY